MLPSALLLFINLTHHVSRNSVTRASRSCQRLPLQQWLREGRQSCPKAGKRPGPRSHHQPNTSLTALFESRPKETAAAATADDSSDASDSSDSDSSDSDSESESEKKSSKKELPRSARPLLLHPNLPTPILPMMRARSPSPRRQRLSRRPTHRTTLPLLRLPPRARTAVTLPTQATAILPTPTPHLQTATAPAIPTATAHPPPTAILQTLTRTARAKVTRRRRSQSPQRSSRPRRLRSP